jgi:hypothetical protein
MKLYTINKLIPFVWTACVFYLLSFDTTAASDAIIWKVVGIDKLIHFFIFLVFAYLWGVFFFNNTQYEKRKISLLLILIGTSFGMGMEFYQKFLTNRSFSYWDGVADAIGTLVGVWLAKKSPYGNRGRNQN